MPHRLLRKSNSLFFHFVLVALLSSCSYLPKKPDSDFYKPNVSSNFPASFRFFLVNKDKRLLPFEDSKYNGIILNTVNQSKIFSKIENNYVDYQTASNGLDIDCQIQITLPEQVPIFFSLITPVPTTFKYTMTWTILDRHQKSKTYVSEYGLKKFFFFFAWPFGIIQTLLSDPDLVIYKVLSQDIIVQIRKDLQNTPSKQITDRML